MLLLRMGSAALVAFALGCNEPMTPQVLIVRITQPAAGTVFLREKVATDATLVAEIPLEAEVGPGVASVEWLAEDQVLIGEGASASYGFGEDGARWVVAHARDAQGHDLATARVDFEVLKGEVTCRGQLDALGVKYRVGPMNKGVNDPITVLLPLHGVNYFFYDDVVPQTELFMDCELAVSLYRVAELSKPQVLAAIEHIGLYVYRCVGGGNPDTGCRASNHSWAKAFDIHELRMGDGTIYNVQNDWVIDPDSQPTCSAATSNAKDAFLHQLACQWHKDKVFTSLLSPNYNAAHHNHFHVELSGSRLINLQSPLSVGVDPPLGTDAH